MPEWSGSLWTTYAVRGFTARRRHPLLGPGRSSTPPTPSRCRPTTWSTRWRRTRVNAHLTLRLNGYNLTDEVYIRSVNNNGGRYNPGLTRSVLLSTQVGF